LITIFLLKRLRGTCCRGVCDLQAPQKYRYAAAVRDCSKLSAHGAGGSGVESGAQRPGSALLCGPSTEAVPRPPSALARPQPWPPSALRVERPQHGRHALQAGGVLAKSLEQKHIKNKSKLVFLLWDHRCSINVLLTSIHLFKKNNKIESDFIPKLNLNF
jgi:hypothetical protein